MLITRKTGRHVDTRRSVTPGNIPKNQCPIAVDQRGMVRRTSANPAKNALRSGNGRYLELHRSQLPSRSTLKPERHDKMNLAAARLDLVLRKSARVPATDDQDPARINHLPLGLRPGLIFRAKRSSLRHGTVRRTANVPPGCFGSKLKSLSAELSFARRTGVLEVQRTVSRLTIR